MCVCGENCVNERVSFSGDLVGFLRVILSGAFVDVCMWKMLILDWLGISWKEVGTKLLTSRT